MIPTRAPFVRETTYTPGISPAQAPFYNDVQDGLAALALGSFGAAASASTEDFLAADYFIPTVAAGVFRVLDNFNGAGLAMILDALPAGSLRQGDHGVLRVRNIDAAAYRFAMASAGAHLGGADFVYQAKVKLVARARLDAQGFWLGLGPPGEELPAFFCDGADASWGIQCQSYSPDSGNVTLAVRRLTIPVLDGQWYELAISRTRGVVRFWINARLVAQLLLPTDLPNARRYVRIARPAPGPLNEGFLIDYFHCFRRR